MGCRSARSLRIQQRASNEVFTLSPATRQWLDWARSAPAGRAPEIRPASCPAIPQGAVIRRARAPAEGFPAADCREVLPAAVRWDGLVSPEGFREVRWACRDNGADAAMFRHWRYFTSCFDAFSSREPVSTHGSSPRACFARKRFRSTAKRSMPRAPKRSSEPPPFGERPSLRAACSRPNTSTV
jgi:hypothetical protein